MDEDIEKKICEVYRKGKSLRAIGAIVKLTQEGVRYILHKYDVPVRSNSKGLDKDKMRKLFKQLGSYQKVADQMGTSGSYVHNVINGRGNICKNKERKKV